MTPSFVDRWVQVTEKALKYHKSRCNAITCCNKPLIAIPLAAIKMVQRVDFDLGLSKKERAKHADILEQQFEIFLKEGFLDLYLRPDYDRKMGHCPH